MYLAHPLYPHQIHGIRYLADNPKALLTDEMGLGKTIQALLALEQTTAAIVVCPASLKGNWYDEIKTWRPDLIPIILKGKKSFRWPKPQEVLILNYELLPKREELDYLFHPVQAIADEAHYLKNSKAQRTENWRGMAQAITNASGTIWGMTGTPLITSPMDLWNLLQSFDLAKEGYGNFTHFRWAWGGRQGKFGIEWSPSGIKPEASRWLDKCSYGRKRVDVLATLPPKRHRDIVVKVRKGVGELQTPEEIDALKKLKFWTASNSYRGMRHQPPGNIMGELSKARRELAVAKGKKALPFIDEIITGGGGPVVVFSAHREPVLELGRYNRWASITGDTGQLERNEIVKRFQGGELDGIAGTIGAMGTGLTLTRSCRMIFLDLPWSPSDVQQAEDRICRIGAEIHDACEYFRIVADTEVDQIIHKSICRKAKMVESVDATRTKKEKVMQDNWDTVGVTELDKLCHAHQEAQEMERKAKARRLEIEGIITQIAPTKDEGTAVTKTRYYKCTTVGKMTRKLDVERWSEIRAQIPEELQPVKVQQVVDLPKLRAIATGNPELYRLVVESKAITTKPAKTSIKVEVLEQ